MPPNFSTVSTSLITSAPTTSRGVETGTSSVDDGDKGPLSVGETAAVVIVLLCFAGGLVYYIGFYRRRLAGTEPLAVAELALNPSTEISLGMVDNPMYTAGSITSALDQPNARSISQQVSFDTGSQSFSQQTLVESTDCDLPSLRIAEQPVEGAYMTPTKNNPQYVSHQTSLESTDYDLPSLGGAERPANVNGRYMTPVTSNPQYVYGSSAISVQFIVPLEPQGVGVHDSVADVNAATATSTPPQHRTNVMYVAGDVDQHRRQQSDATDTASSSSRCSHRSKTDGLACRSDAVVGSAQCARHTCTIAGCGNPKPSRDSLCVEHAGTGVESNTGGAGNAAYSTLNTDGMTWATSRMLRDDGPAMAGDLPMLGARVVPAQHPISDYNALHSYGRTRGVQSLDFLEQRKSAVKAGIKKRTARKQSVYEGFGDDRADDRASSA